jgi:phospholipid/cholesterol/gamma-HCH transport system substrate-binding protein
LNVARAAVLAVLLVAVVVAGALLLRGTATSYVVVFQNAGQLVPGDDVQIGGRRVGSVYGIELTSDNQARVKVSVEAPYAPLHDGTRAVIRQTSLSGIANRYVALTPGADNAREIADGGTLSAEATTTPVDLDQLFNTLDPAARADLQHVIKGFATQYDGRGPDANAAARYLSPALSTTRRLAAELDRDSGALSRFLVNTSKATSALAERRDDVAGLVSNSSAVAGAVAQESDALSAALARLPTTLRKGNSTFVNLRSTLDDLDELVRESKPATRRLAPFLAELRPLLVQARPTVRDLRTLIDRPGADNDLLEATRKLPRLQRVATPALANTTRALRDSQKVLEFGRPYSPDLIGFVRDFGQSTSAYDANGHYARVQPIFNAFSFTDDERGGTLSAVPAARRFDQFRTDALKRCPGAATQPPADSSAPFTDGSNLSPEDCDPSQTPPGP